jgi:large subunit ribosomal protein L4
MMSIPVYNIKKEQVGTVEFPERFMNGSSDESGLVYQAVIMQLASQRQGTASTRGRGEVSGSGKKPWKQKHTGRARAGSVRSPIWRHGGTVFGPKPRSYGFQIPRKMYRRALHEAMALKIAEENIIVVDFVQLSETKTRALVDMISSLGGGGKSLVIIDGNIQDIQRIGRNIRNVKIAQPSDLNVYDVLWCEKMIVTERSIKEIQDIWG